jgi:beta-glucosidase
VFRIATLNQYQGHVRWDERRHLILEQLLDLRPDVLCLNEVSVPLDSGRWLWQEAERGGLSYAYVQYNKSGARSLDEGLGLLTRFPIHESGGLDYETKGRVAQVVRMEVEGRLLDVYVTHLHHTAEEDGLRVFQVRRLFDWLAARGRPDGVVMCGDFNATPEMESARLMQTQFTPTQTAPTFRSGLRDRTEGSEEHEPLDRCIDYVWYRRPLRLVAGGACFDKPHAGDPTLWPSDHIGVWADFEWEA